MRKQTTKNQLNEEIYFLNSVATKLLLYPRTEDRNLNFYGYYLIYSLVILTVVQLTFTLYLHGFKNLIEFTNVAPNIGVCLISALKYTKVHSNKCFYDKFFQHYGEDIWELDTYASVENNKITTKYMYVAKVINRLFVFYSLPLILVVNSFPWIIMLFESKVLRKDITYLYPFDGWYPFDKVQWYYAIYSWESLMTAIVILIYMYADMVNIFFVICMCMEFRVLGNNFRNLITEDDIQDIAALKDAKEIHPRTKSKLRYIIVQHDLLVNMSKELNVMLGNTMFVNYTFGCIFICLTAFTFTMVDDFFKSIRCFFFFLSLLAAVLDHCIIGQVISDHSVRIADDIYSSDWLYADQSTKKTILLLIMRTQKPVTLTANGLVVMDLHTFTDIISTSYQLFNLLRTVYQP